MQNAVVAVLVLVVLPAVYFAWRLSLLEKRWVRWTGGVTALILLIVNFPREGLDFTHIKRLNLFLAAAAIVLMGLRQLEVRWVREPKNYFVSLSALAAASLVVYLNFFSFHRERTYVHYHDVAHYYLGSKYFRELGYSNLYTAMLRAEAEVFDNRFKTLQARDLSTYELVDIRLLLRASDPVKASFSTERWTSFKKDVAFFRETLGRQYQDVLKDHGFNPTPLWALVGGGLANLVPAGSGGGILLLTLLDPVLLIGSFAAIGWAFGAEALLLCVTHFCLIYGATFGWTGGAFLRYLWFFGVVVGLGCLKKNRYSLAGSFLAGATLLRIFPVFFLTGILFKAAPELKRGAVPRSYLRLFLSFMLTGALLFLISGGLPEGFRHWEDFGENLRRQVENISPNVIGLTGILAFRAGPMELSAEAFRESKERRTRIYRIQLATVFLATLIFVALVSRHEDDVGASIMGILLIFAGVNLASYYYAFLILLLVVHLRQPLRVALIFGIELMTYGLLLFEEREAVLFFYRNLLILYLLAALHLDSAGTLFRRRNSSGGGLSPAG